VVVVLGHYVLLKVSRLAGVTMFGFSIGLPT
jgi:hypothetical protein